jgi:hypothetical protein
MTEESINEVLDSLRDGKIREYLIEKEDFLPFRQVLIKREDFKHFRGIAQRGGGVLYQYLQEPRS